MIGMPVYALQIEADHDLWTYASQYRYDLTACFIEWGCLKLLIFIRKEVDVSGIETQYCHCTAQFRLAHSGQFFNRAQIRRRASLASGSTQYSDPRSFAHVLSHGPGIKSLVIRVSSNY